jgi:WD40 repeat protein
MLGVPTNFSPDVCFSPDGRQILSGFDYIILWDITTGREIKNFSGDIAGAGNISFNKDGRQILSGGNPIKIWDAVNGREIKTFSGYGEVVFSPDEKQILSVTGDTIKIWDAANGQEIKNLVGVNYASSAAFSPDGKQILSGGRPAQLWDAASGREIRNFPWNANWGLSFVSISPDGEQAIWGGWSTLELWDITTGREIRTFPVDVVCMIYSAVFSPDGKLILSGSENPAVKLWDTVTGYEIRTFIGHTDSVYSVVFSPDGRQALSGSGDKTIKLWDVATGREIMTFSGHASGVYSVVFSPDGKRVLSSSGDGTIRIWDIVTGKEIIQFISFFDGEWLAITPDGYYNASPRGDQYLNVRVGNNVYGIDQYRTTFYRPRIVEARLQGMPDPVYTAAAIQEAASFEPPLVVIRSPENGAGLTSGQTELSVSVVDRTQPIQSIRVVVNGRLVGGEALQGINGVRGGRLEATGIRLTEHQNRVDFQLPLSLDPGTNRIEVTANNPYSEGRDIVEVNYRAAAQNILPNLWILSIGINRYDDPLLQNLDYAVNDAKEIIDVFKAQEGKLYRTVHSLLIADGAAVAPTKDNIIDNFDFLKSAGQRDIALLFIAGHGMNDDGGRYYLMPSDAGFNADGSIRPSKAISYRDIQGVLDVPGQKLVFIDSCHSEGVSGRRTRGADNNQLVRELQDNSTVIFTASRGNQLSQERPELGHGVFTYAIIQGMMGEADLVKDGTVTMKELDTYVSEMVPRLTSGLQQPTTNTPEGYVNFVVADVR